MKLLVLILFFMAHLSFGQGIVIEKDGKSAPYKKIKFFHDYAEIVDEDRERIKIGLSDVVGYFDTHSQIVYYKKPLIPVSDKVQVIPRKRSEVEYEFVMRESVGKISLFKKEVISGGYVAPGMLGSTPTTTVYYYAEKGEFYENVYVTSLFRDKAGELNALKSFINDDAEILKKMEDEKFQFNVKNLINIVREYNLRNFQHVEGNEYKSQSNVGFYTTVRPKLKEKLVLRINDSLEYKLTTSRFPLYVALPNLVPSKVCVIWDTGTSCELITSVAFQCDHFELKYHAGDKTFEIEKKSFREYKNYIEDIRRQ